jgi:phosphoribosylaminoimidazole-succinocarboxamide synthase
MELVHSGKVRDVYADGDDLILVASDRVSVYDVVLPTGIPDKGAVLTRLSLWWFDQLTDIIPNHVVSATDVPEQWVGRAIRCQRLDMVKVECVPGISHRQRARERHRQDVAYRSRHGWSVGPLAEPSSPDDQAPMGEHGGHDVQAVIARRAGRPRHSASTLRSTRGGSPAGGIIIADTKVEWAGTGRSARTRGRDTHPRSVAVLGCARSRVATGLVRQADRAGLGRGYGLGQDVAGAADTRRCRGQTGRDT